MATVSAEVRFAPQLTAWFTANPTKVLQDGEIVYCSDGANIGKYVIGDNSTQLSALTFYGGISSSGLTIGTTTITSGTNTRILYNNNGVVGEYSVTGTGTTAVLSTSPTFTTDITTPLIIGGTAVGSVIQYKGTTGVGTSAVAAHQFLVGNNGASTILSIYNSGTSSFTPIGGGTMSVGSASGVAGLNFSGTISIGELALWGTGTNTVIGTPQTITLRVNNAIQYTVNNTTHVWSPSGSASSGAVTNFTYTCGTYTNQTLSTNIPNFKVTGSTKQWATGALATQYFNYFSANTVAFVGASTATDVYQMYLEKPLAGTNATITNSWALGANGAVNLTLGTASIILANLATTTTNSALYMNVTPSTTNYTIRSNGSNTWLSTGGSSLLLQTGATTKFTIDSYKTTWSPATYSGSGVGNLFELNPANGSALTTGQEISTFVIGSSTKQYNTGAMATHRDNWIKTTTIAYTGASTLTNYYGLYVEAAIAGTNATITNNYAAGFAGKAIIAYAAAAGDSLFTISDTSTTGNQNGLQFKNSNTDAASRNWALLTNDTAYGDFVIKTSAAAGGDAMAGTRRFMINPSGSVILNNAAIATTATDGFLYIATCNGAPTGVPTAYSGRVAMVFDISTNKFYIYNGAWKSATLA